MISKTQLIEKLIKLKNNNGLVAVKAEFEAEGSRKDELIMLREIVDAAGLGIIIKIGGCEAVHDIDQCKLLGASGVMAPMIETPFAMSKFRGAVSKIYGDDSSIERIINAETVTCLTNFDDILKKGKDFLTGVTVGRSDLSASMGIARSNIECDEVFNTTREFCEKAKKVGLVTNFGGNIGIESVPFIIKMYPFIDRFETRKVVLKKNDDPEFVKEAIKKALEFELLYLKYKSEYYMNMATEDKKRIDRLNKQLQ